MNLSDFSLMKEDNTHYEVKHPNGKGMKIPKQGLSEKSHAIIKKMKRGGMVKGYAEGGDIEAPASDESSDQSVATQQIPDALRPTEASPQVAEPTAATPTSSGDLSQAPGQTAEDMMRGKANTIEGALQEQKGFMQQEGAAEAKGKQQEARAIQDTEKQMAAMPTQQDIIAKNKLKDDTLFQAFADKKIDPNRIFKDQSTGSKIGMGIAMVLSGMGSGVTGQPNMAAQMLKETVDRDVAAQAADKSGAETAWKMNREALGSDLAASLATQNQAYTAMKYKLQEAASQAASPAILARAGQAGALIDQKIAENRFQLGLMQQGTGGGSEKGGFAGEDPSILVPHLIKEPALQQKAFDEIDAAKAAKANAPAILEAFDQAAKDVRVMSGGKFRNLLPGVQSAYNMKLEALMGPTFKDVEGTVRQAAMDNMSKNTHPEGFDSDEKIAQKREALVGYLKSKSQANSVAKGHGIDLSKFRSTAHDFGEETKTMGGVKYTKVPGGWQRAK